MKILIISVGKKHDDTVQAGILEFEKRLGADHVIEWKIIPSSTMRDEGEIIERAFKEGDFIVALDDKGKEMETREVSEWLNKIQVEGSKRLVFVIGGSYGLDSLVFTKARVSWSLSKLTFPHQLVRLILVEQLYRAFSILKGSKYHHE
ncbi:MAG: hypothetical protein RJA61_352 [Candidatus Parcubacteria bacterium]|jgi:23S rRNA (pseudouridine1915-N3)-methyltransferase